VSPAIFKLGPATVGTWTEARSWQIASDAAGDIILLWDGLTIPTGWTCLNCATSDPFYGVFIRASSTYGNASTGGPEVVGHNFQIQSYTTSSATTQKNSGATNQSNETHTHPGSSTIISGTTDIRPPFKNLWLIRANTTTLPNGVIGMFEVSATSALPSGWLYATSTDGRYLRGGENTTSTGGSSSHNHSLSTTTAAASGQS